MRDDGVNLWDSPTHALQYLARADSIPHRTEGEAELLEWLPLNRRASSTSAAEWQADALVRLACPEAEAVALDFSDHARGDARPVPGERA